jgi:hypothetical protein
MAKIEALNAKLTEYLKDPKDRLDISRMGIDAEEAKIVASFLSTW